MWQISVYSKLIIVYIQHTYWKLMACCKYWLEVHSAQASSVCIKPAGEELSQGEQQMAAESAVVLCLRNTFFKGRATRRNIEQNNAQTSIYAYTQITTWTLWCTENKNSLYQKQKFAYINLRLYIPTCILYWYILIDTWFIHTFSYNNARPPQQTTSCS